MSKLHLEQGKFYRNRNGDTVQITAEISKGEIGFDLGFRFKDSKADTFKPNGSWAVEKNKTSKDLLEELSA